MVCDITHLDIYYTHRAVLRSSAIGYAFALHTFCVT